MKTQKEKNEPIIIIFKETLVVEHVQIISANLF